MSEQPVEPAAPVQETHWRRLSARMLLIHPLRALKDLLPGLLPLLLVGNAHSDGGSEWWNVGAAAMVLLVALLTWMTTTYRVADGRVQQQHGLLRRDSLTVPLDRVRTVDTEASPIHRVLGLATVRIGTGVAGGKPLVLDGLTTAAAEELRRDLLAYADPLRSGSEDGLPVGGAPSEAAASGAAERADAEVLARFSPSWVRFAPLSTSGLLTAFALLGFLSQTASQVLSDDDWHRFDSRAAELGVLGVLATGGVLLVLTVVGCAAVAYVLAYWGHVVTRPSVDRLHVRRGLLTVRSTTLDLTRLRGVHLGETLPMRWAGGATLKAVTTGLGGRHADAGPGSGSGAGLLPPAPRRACVALTSALLGGDPLSTPLQAHGPAARRRRWTRALWIGVIVLACGLVLARWTGWAWGWFAPCAVPLLAAPFLAEDRYRQLGHAVVPGAGGRARLVTRHGSLHRSTVVLEAEGVVGWTVRQTFWQRRARVATLVAATAAGTQRFHVTDLPASQAWAVAREVTPQVLAVTDAGARTD